jgi:hypothetical protein
MQNSRTAAIFAFVMLSAVFCAGQMPAAPAMPPAQNQTPPATASSVLQPSIDVVVNTLNALNLDKWKKGSVREEAANHVHSILRDVQTNLPPVMAAADAAPGSLSAAMPLVKHLDALYDVLLRVEEGSRVAAPSDQIGTLQQALVVFSTARFALDDALQKQAVTQEKQLSDLRVAVTKETAARTAAEQKAAAVKPCTPPAKPVRRRKRTTPAKKPQGTAAPQKPQSPATPQKPQ